MWISTRKLTREMAKKKPCNNAAVNQQHKTLHTKKALNQVLLVNVTRHLRYT